jgi:hypothetical protein
VTGVRAYAEYLERKNSSATAIGRLIELKIMASIMDPNRDWAWIYRVASAIRARHNAQNVIALFRLRGCSASGSI